jgi:hypothetical protein
MDAFITTVLAGIIVAVVGAIVAYYFGGVREKRKQEYDRQKEEQIRQEERQKDQNKRRIEAVDGLRSRAYTVTTSFWSWFNRTFAEEEDVPFSVAKNPQNGDSVESTVKRFPTLIREGKEDLEPQMTALWHYYAEKKPYLDPQTIELFEPFYRSLQLLRGKLIDTMGELYWHYEQGHGRYTWWTAITATAQDHENNEQYHRAVQAFFDARWDVLRWDPSAQLEGLSAESKRLMGE